LPTTDELSFHAADDLAGGNNMLATLGALEGNDVAMEVREGETSTMMGGCRRMTCFVAEAFFLMGGSFMSSASSSLGFLEVLRDVAMMYAQLSQIFLSFEIIVANLTPF
jgi:hypothetical protein